MDSFATRRDKLRKELKKLAADSLLVTNPKNVTYLTGFTGDDSYLLVTAKDVVVLSDPRFTTQLEQECPGLDLHIRPPGTSMIESVVKTAAKAKVQHLGVESDSMTLALCERISDKFESGDIVATSGLVERLRLIKDKNEIAAIRLAVDSAQRAFKVIRASLRGEQTEKEVADALEHQMRLFGAKTASFDTIVAVGERAALPHARPTDVKINADDFVLIDWGADQQLYKSDLTRVLLTGKISPKLQKVYGVVLKAQQLAIEAIAPGKRCEEIDRVAREYIDKAGFGKYFGHGLGHGLGLDIHEGPRLACGNPQVLEPGMVVTVEPGIYLPGWGGVRIEDDVLVTKTGHEVLTNLPKSWEDACAV